MRGEIVCSDPLIIYKKSGKAYYWVKNSKFVEPESGMFGYTGKGNCSIIRTGNYVTWNDKTCVECTAVDISKAKEYEQKISDKREQIDKYNKAINAVFTMNYFNADLIDLKVGEKKSLKLVLSEDKYNKITWKSSDKSIVTVSKKGVVKAVAPGRATITASASISGAKFSVDILVEKNINSNKLFDSTVKVGNTTFPISSKLWDKVDEIETQEIETQTGTKTVAQVSYIYDPYIIVYYVESGIDNDLKYLSDMDDEGIIIYMCGAMISSLESELDCDEMSMKDVQEENGIYYGEVVGIRPIEGYNVPFVLFLKIHNNTLIQTYLYDFEDALGRTAEDLAFEICKRATN